MSDPNRYLSPNYFETPEYKKRQNETIKQITEAADKRKKEIMSEPRRDAIYDVKITSPGVVFELTKTDYDTAFNICKTLMDSTPDQKLKDYLAECLRSFGFSGLSADPYSIRISAKLPETETGEIQTCGRRMADFGNWERKPDLDTWRLIGKDRICSFCGSLHPDRVIELIKEHGMEVIDPSTKSYKFYIRQPNVPNSSFGGIKYYRFHDTPEFVKELKELIGAKPNV